MIDFSPDEQKEPVEPRGSTGLAGVLAKSHRFVDAARLLVWSKIERLGPRPAAAGPS